MINIIFIAPPAAGKGTISSELVEAFGYVHVSTGDLLREEQMNQTEIGLKIEAIIARGEFVSDGIITSLLEKRISTLNKSFILDGFPRNIEQAMTLEEIFKRLRIDNYVAIYLDVSEEEALSRATGRMICPKCKISYHKYFEEKKPKFENICDHCHVELIQRDDDKEETYKVRYKNFLELTYPIVDFYKSKGKLKNIDVNMGTDKALIEIKSIVGEDKW